MGIFGPRKTIYVSSSIYNLAGNYDERTNYLKQLVLTGIFNNQSVGSSIINGTLKGPKIDYQVFYKWAKKNYTLGMPEGGVFKSNVVASSLIVPYIPERLGWIVQASQSSIDFGDYMDWASTYVIENHPELWDTDWFCQYDDDTGDITITYVDTTTETFTPVGFTPKARYITTRYSYVIDPDLMDVGTLEVDGPIQGPDPSILALPNTDDYDLVSEVDDLGIDKEIYKTVRTIVTYSDSRPGSDDTVSTLEDTVSYDKLTQTYEFMGALQADPLDVEHMLRRKHVTAIWQEPRFSVTTGTSLNIVEIEPGVFETTEIITKTPAFSFPAGSDWYWKIDERLVDWGYRSEPTMFSYQIGTGNLDLDALDEIPNPEDGYFPMMPVRTHNKMINQTPLLEDVYPHAKKYWKKVSGGKVDKLIEQVEDNASLPDIDHAFIIYGVCLNTLSREGKMYIHQFMRKLMIEQLTEPVAYQAFLDQSAAKQAYLDAMEDWKVDGGEMPIEPAEMKISLPAKTSIRVTCENPNMSHYDFRIYWRTIEETNHVGEISPGAKLKSVVIRKGTTRTFKDSFYGAQLKEYTRTVNDEVLEILYQETENTYKMLTIYGMVHKNFVYGGKAVETATSAAMDDVEDCEFIVPLHYSTMRALPLIRANQLCTESSLIVFNSYLVHKKKWYETFLGQILIALIFVGVSAIFSGGASLTAGGGMLGSNAAIGAMFGATGIQAAILGAVANAVAGVLINAIMNEVLVKVFGAKFAAIFGAILGIVMSGFTKGLLGGEFNFSFNTFLKADNLLKLTNAAATAYSIHIAEKTQKVYDATDKMLKDHQRVERQNQGDMISEFGYGVYADPMALTNVLESEPEYHDTFISRTLMTGSDISELTRQMITDFSAINLDLEILKG